MKSQTSINFVLDRSGSMAGCKKHTIETFNDFLVAQRNCGRDTIVSLFQFDSEYTPVYYNLRANDAPLLNDENFQPRSMTALLDAIGRTIDDVGRSLSQLPEHERPDKVFIVVLTDGEENASQKYSRERIKAMIEHQQGRYNWTFVYLGANQDSFLQSSSMGFVAGNTKNYTPTKAGFDSMKYRLISAQNMANAAPVGAACTNYFGDTDQTPLGSDQDTTLAPSSPPKATVTSKS